MRTTRQRVLELFEDEKSIWTQSDIIDLSKQENKSKQASVSAVLVKLIKQGVLFEFNNEGMGRIKFYSINPGINIAEVKR